MSHANVMTDRRRPLFTNSSQRIARDQLRGVAPDARAVHREQPIAQVLRIDGAPLSRELREYALMAAFDHVVFEHDGEGALPLFAVEFDEPHHDTDPPTIRRDAKKHAVCRALGFPYLRVGSEHLCRYDARASVLEWLASRWQLRRGRTDDGELGDDAEIVDFADALDLSQDARLELLRRGLATETRTFLEPTTGRMATVAWVNANGKLVAAMARLREHGFTQLALDLLSECAVIDVVSRLQSADGARPAAPAEPKGWLEAAEDWVAMP